MKLFTRAGIIGPIGLVMATAAGTATAAAPSGPETAPATCESAAAPATPEATKQDAAREPFGPMALVADALSKLCLSDDQRAAIQKLGEQVRPKEQAVADARHAFVMALAEQLRSGNVDEGALKDKIDALVAARQDASPVLRKSLDDLHGILDAGQRAAFTDAIEGRMKDIAGASGGWADDLAKDLGLSDDQKQRVQSVLGKAKPALQKERDTGMAAFDAFKSDDFSIDKVDPMGDVGARTRAKAESTVAAAKEIAAILTPDQRVALADRLEGKAGQAGAGAASRQAEEPIVATHASYHAGAVGGWGGGYAARGASYTSVRGGYAAGYPLVGGYGPGVW